MNRRVLYSPEDDRNDSLAGGKHEWVVVLKGEAKLLFDGDDEPIHMKPGDHLTI